MRLLDRYLLRELMLPLGYCLCGFLIFWISTDLFSDLDRFQKLELRAGDVFEYYVMRLPELLVTVTPIALLLALLYALTQHARHHELVAIRAAGVGLWRLSLPYFAVGFFFSLVMVGLNEFGVPRSAAAVDRIESRHVKNPTQVENQWLRPFHFGNARDRRNWSIEAYNLQTGEMIRPDLDWRFPDGSRRWIHAEHAERQDGVWIFHQVVEHFYPKDQPDDWILRTTNLLELAELTETPAQIRNEVRINSLDSFKASKQARLSLWEILDYRRWHPDMRADKRAVLGTLLHMHLAAPWTCLVVVLIALPFGLRSGRRNVFVGVASSIFICFAFFTVREFSSALGAGGYVAPWLAAWLPNLVFAGAALAFIQRVR
jgi:lipopolysaccharide export system permease protein